jgi:hypothetical protein
MVRALLKWRANQKSEGLKDQRPLQLALNNGLIEIAKILQNEDTQ